MGRRKIEIKPIRDDRNRSVTFLKRKGGLFKKAHELSVLCSVDVAVVIFGHNKKLYEFSSSDMNAIMGRYHYYGAAHEHKGPQDFTDKGAGDDDEDDEGGEEGEPDKQTPAPPEHAMMQAQMQNHPGFQHVRHGTPSGSPPMHNGAMPQFQRGPSPLPPGMSRPSSRASQHPQHPQHLRRTSSNLVPQPGQPGPPSYAYQPNPPFYNPQQAAHMQQRPPPPPTQGMPPHAATYPHPYPPHPPHPQHPQAHPHMQPYMQDDRRSSMPPAFPPQPPPQADMRRHPSHEHLQPPGQQPRPQSRTPQPGQQRPTPSPQPPQQAFASPPIPQPKPLPANAKAHNIFTPIDDSRSMLAQHWGSTDPSGANPTIKVEGGGPRAQSIDVAAMQRGKNAKTNGTKTAPAKAPPKSPQPGSRTNSTPAVPVPTRSNTNQSDAKRPRLKVQIPSEQSGDEGGTASAPESSTQTAAGATQSHGGPSHGVVLPPPSPSAGALLSAGARGPPNPFARPAPPMTTNPHAANRDIANNIETPISALPSRFMNDNLLPSPSNFFPDWNFSRSGDSNMLPSPLNFQTPVVPNGPGWREEERKRGSEDQDGGDAKRVKT